MDLTVYPLRRDGADRLLVLLHGWSAEQHHLAAYVPLVDPDERFTALCPRGPYDLDEGDGASWYRRDGDGTLDAGSVRSTIEAVESFIVASAAAEAIPIERCVVGGFSQGGFLTLALAGKPGALPYAGIWAMCCGLPVIDGLDVDLSDGRGRPALVQLGERDEIITPERVRAVGDALVSGGWNVELQGYEMAHSQTIEMMIDARAWLGAID